MAFFVFNSKKGADNAPMAHKDGPKLVAETSDNSFTTAKTVAKDVTGEQVKNVVKTVNTASAETDTRMITVVDKTVFDKDDLDVIFSNSEIPL